MARPKEFGDTKPVSFRIPVALADRLEDLKWRSRMNKADIVRNALAEYLDKLEEQISKQEVV